MIAFLLASLIGFQSFFATSAIAGAHEARVAATSGADAGYAHPAWLADAGWLQAHLTDPTVKVVALTPAQNFARGHIPGAAQIDWPDIQIVETSDQSVKTWRGEVEGTLTRLGVSPGDTVVVYDGGTVYAPRLWWVLHQLGHADKRILNGDLAAWTAAGGALETGPSRAKPAAQPYVGKPDESAIATLDEVKARLGGPNVAFVDARSAPEYAAGHLPGAVNVEFTRNAAPAEPKRWKPAAELRAIYAGVGVTPGKTIIPYCATGVRSAATYFTLRLIGYQDVSLFTGSWKEWSSHPELPRTTGDTP